MTTDYYFQVTPYDAYFTSRFVDAENNEGVDIAVQLEQICNNIYQFPNGEGNLFTEYVDEYFVSVNEGYCLDVANELQQYRADLKDKFDSMSNAVEYIEEKTKSFNEDYEIMKDLNIERPESEQLCSESSNQFLPVAFCDAN